MGIVSNTGTALIYLVYAGQLKGTMPMPPDLKKALDGRGLTQSDYDKILSTNPFASGSGTIDPGRFLATPQSFPYMPPPDENTQPVIFSRDLSNSQIQTNTYEVKVEYSVSIDMDISFLKSKNKLTWTSTNSSGKSATTSQSAKATVGGPAYGYEGPTTVLVYWDTLYSSFMFAFPTQPPSYTGTVRDESGQPVTYEEVTLTVGGYQFTTLTDWQGEYRFYDTPSGEGTIDVDGHLQIVEVGGSENR